jgi:NADH-quinone oxidoreductase subunit M
MVQMVSHGFVSAAMFLCVGVLYDRLHSREIATYGGVIHTMPWFGAFLVFFAMANAGLPGTSGFVGEFMVILASFRADFWFALLAATTLIIGAAYTLWMVKRVVFGPVASDGVATLQDMDRREFLVLGLLAVAVLALGLWPAPLVEVMDASVENLVRHVAAKMMTP